jgi:hypothetical protein
VRPDRAGQLYDVAMRYDADRAVPRYAFDTATRTLTLGLSHEQSRRRWRNEKGSELRLALSPRSDLDLSIEAGAAEGDIDLTGLRIAALTLAGGAADTRLRIDAPNPLQPGTVRLDAGAANLEVLHAANLHAERIEVNVGVGRVLLDLTGDWRGDLALDLSAAVGAVDLVVPADIGIRVERTAMLQSTDFPGLQRVGEAWESPGLSQAVYTLRVTTSGALGRITLRRTTR